MDIIAHRINTIKELKAVPEEFGVEIDLRGNGNNLILQHEPFKDGEHFEEFISYYKHKSIILNIKSERIEYNVLDILKKYNIKNYFFLDSSFPMIYQLSKNGEKNIAVRFSEFEGIDTILALKGMVKWIWVDCFTKLPINRKNFEIMKEADYKICIVSPDLYGRDEEIKQYSLYLKKNGIDIDAVCTKPLNIKEWGNHGHNPM